MRYKFDITLWVLASVVHSGFMWAGEWEEHCGLGRGCRKEGFAGEQGDYLS